MGGGGWATVRRGRAAGDVTAGKRLRRGVTGGEKEGEEERRGDVGSVVSWSEKPSKSGDDPSDDTEGAGGEGEGEAAEEGTDGDGDDDDDGEEEEEETGSSTSPLSSGGSPFY